MSVCQLTGIRSVITNGGNEGECGMDITVLEWPREAIRSVDVYKC